MSEITDLLWLKAQELGAQATAGQNEWQLVKSAAVHELESNGVSGQDASEILDALATKANPNLEADLEKSAQLAHISEILEKAAQYVADLEVKLSTKEEEIEGMQKAANKAAIQPSVEALNGTGAFSEDDLSKLSQLDEVTLSKVASFTNSSPQILGGPSAQPSAYEDAIMDFIHS